MLLAFWVIIFVLLTITPVNIIFAIIIFMENKKRKTTLKHAGMAKFQKDAPKKTVLKKAGFKESGSQVPGLQETNPQKANYILRAKRFRAKKRLGQNFLIEPEIVEKITSNVEAEDVVLEIGPGLGFVTEKLVNLAKKVVAVELDEDAIKVLEKNLGKKENFTLIHSDILKTNLKDIFKEEFEHGKKIKVVANIPYYITSPIIAHLLGEIDEINNENRNMIDEIILMVQYEVALRLVANEKSPNKEYGMLSILAQFWADCNIIKNVSKRCFMPSPKVDSAILKIKINDAPKCEITPFLKRTIKAAFSGRRKNIKNSLQNAGFLEVEKALNEAGFEVQTRGEKLSIEDFCTLSKALYKYNPPVSGKEA